MVTGFPKSYKNHLNAKIKLLLMIRRYLMDTQEQLDFLINYLVDERNEAIEIPEDYQEKRNLLRALMNIRMPSKVSDEFLKFRTSF